jgi:ubiquinol-cytochrome c reductase cytochrome c1 subunit
MFARLVRETATRATRATSATPQVARVRAMASSSRTASSKSKMTQNGSIELGLAGLSILTMGGLFASTEAHAESPDHIHPLEMPWGHAGIFSGYDTASIRRGYIVYKNVCAACHSLERIHFRELVGVCMSEDEAKAAAAEIDVVDGPNDIGQMFERPGKLSDPLPSPYANGKCIHLLVFFRHYLLFILFKIY